MLQDLGLMVTIHNSMFLLQRYPALLVSGPISRLLLPIAAPSALQPKSFKYFCLQISDSRYLYGVSNNIIYIYIGR